LASRHEVVEHAEYRTLVEDLLELRPGDGAEEGRQALEETSAMPDDLLLLRAENVRLKRLAERMFVALTSPPGTAEALHARQLLTVSARRQTERELSWARMTGFPGAQPSVSDVLAAQAAG
jgi:hypothetical protein